MPWNNANEILVGSNGQVYVAPVGTPLPATPVVALNAAFTGLGYVTEDGVTISVAPTVEDYMAWQSRSPVRREKTANEITIAFALMQWNEQTIPAAFGGGSVSGSAGNYRYDLPSDNAALDERAVIVDAIDGAVVMRSVFPRCNATEAVEAAFQRGAPASLPLTFSALAPADGVSPGYFLSNSAAFAPGS